MPTLEPNDLPGYILSHYSHFTTKEEAKERQYLGVEYKELMSILKKEYGTVSAGKFTVRLPDEVLADPRFKEYAERRRRFFNRTSKRILEEHGKDVFLYYCPNCGALARTPKAKQRGVCHRRWTSGS